MRKLSTLLLALLGVASVSAQPLALEKGDNIAFVGSGQASILLERGTATVAQLLESITRAGYRAIGFTQGSGPAA